MAGSPSASPLSFLMNALVAVLVISFAVLVRRP
jgi:hypothetical protein